MKKLWLVVLLCSLFAAPTAAQPPENYWNDVVWYEIFVRSFYDSNGDGIGDFQGIIEKLDYLNDGDPTTDDDLGITGIWLMPINPSPSYHGYDVTDYYAINPDYGTMADFEEFLAEAHARGIKVIIDLVINHSSDQHPWFVNSITPGSEYDDWYVWRDEKPDTLASDGSQVWYPRGDRHYYAAFVAGMPDLNHENPEVINEIFNIVDFWVGEIGVDGFRIDAVKFLIEEESRFEDTSATRDYMKRFTEYVHRVNPDAIVIGEIWSATRTVAQYTNSDAVDLSFEFDLAQEIFSSVRGGNARAVSRMIERGLRDYTVGRYATFLTNHDQERYATRVDGALGRLKPAATILMTIPGSPFIYYGEELGMAGPKPDERIRTPMQWDATPVTAGFTTADRPHEPLAEGELDGINVADQFDDEDSLLAHYRDLIALRNSETALTEGDIQVMDSATRGIFSFLRYTDDETLLILINLDDDPVEEIELTLEESILQNIESAEVILGDHDAVTLPEINATGGFDAYSPVEAMEPFTSLIIRLN